MSSPGGSDGAGGNGSGTGNGSGSGRSTGGGSGNGGSADRTGRVTAERSYVQMGYFRGDRSHIFDGTESNFAAWKWRVEHHLAKMNLLDCLKRTPDEEVYAMPVEGATEEEEAARVERYRKRVQDDIEAIDEIVMAINNDVLNKIVGVTYAKDAMNILSRTYQKVGTGALMSMRQRLFMLRNKKFENLEKLFDEYDLIIRELDRMDAKLTDSEKVHALLIAVPEKFANVKGALTVLSNEELCRKSIYDIKRMLLDAELASVDVAGRSEGSSVALVNKTARKVIKCFGCNEIGHFKNRCPKKKPPTKNNKRTGGGGHAMMAGTSAVPTKKKKQVRFIVDSGATEHMVKDETLLEEVKVLDKPIKISTAKSGQGLRATKSGKMRLKSVIGLNKMTPITLYNVLFIPGLESNLLSVRKSNEMGKKVVFVDDSVSFMSSGEVIARGTVVDGLYCLDFTSDSSIDLTAMLGTQHVSIEKLHKRLGHLSFSGIEKLMKANMVEGINHSSTKGNLRVCESCLAGKHSAKRFEHLDLPRSNRPLEIIHSDVCGPMEVNTYNGFRYFVTFTDDYTHFAIVYLIARKSEVLDKFQEFKVLVERHFSRNIAKLRCDNGGEYIGNEFGDFCKSNGIQMMFTIPYTPQQNGVSERINRTLMEKVRAMLHESGMPKEMWGEALHCAVYITNRCPTNGLVENKTPFEMFFDKRPNLSNLRIFGSTAYAQIPKEKRQKLDSKTKRLVFVGYANNGYRLWNKQSRSIETSRNVIFDEDKLYKNHLECSIDKNSKNSPDEIVALEYISVVHDRENKVIEAEENKSGDEGHKEGGVENTSGEEGHGEADEENISGNEEDNTSGIVEETLTEISVESNYESTSEDQPAEDENATQPPRRSERERRMPVRYTDYEMAKTASTLSDENPIPQTVEQLMKRDDWEQWKAAIDSEIKSLEDNRTWTVADKNITKKAIQSKWVFNIKEDGRYKARLVAKGCSQRPGFDYSETFSPVARMESVRIVLSMANEMKLHIHQMDVTTAFLNGELEEVIYMQLPNDEFGKGQNVLLQKSLYGLKQASRSWNKRFDNAIRNLGFTQLKCDSCVYKNKQQGLILILYVDDLLIVGANLDKINWIKSELGKLFQMKDLSEVSHFLGMDIKRDLNKQILEISQTGYTERILKRFGMYDCKPVGSPLDTNVKWTRNNGEVTEYPYKELLGCLQYLAITTRPDICAAVSALSKYQSCPSDAHWRGLKRILRYLRGTLDTRIVYQQQESPIVLKGYADADFANDEDDRKSVSGYVFQVYGNIVAWATKKQQTVSLSSSEAELIALSCAVKEGMWLANFLYELNVVSIPFIIMEDNIPCIKYAEEPRSHQRMKHLDIKYMHIRDLIKKGSLKLQFLSSEEQPADAFTKGLPRKQHKYLFERLNVRIEGKC